MALVMVAAACRLGSSSRRTGGERRVAASSAAAVSVASEKGTVAVVGNNSSHPRLFFDGKDLPALQAVADSTHAVLWNAIRTQVRSQFKEKPELTSSSRRNLETFRGNGNQMVGLAFACVITQANEYCNAAKRNLLTFASWDEWANGNERSLGMAHMVQGNAIAYDWLYNILTPEERERVRNSLAGWTQKLYEASAEEDMVGEWQNWWRKAYVQNHYHTIHGAIGTAALALLGEDERAEMWLQHVVARLELALYFLNHIVDGSWHEGMGYQGYMLSEMLPFLVNLRKIEGQNFLPNEYLQEFATWRIYNHLPGTDEFILPFGDVSFDYLGADAYNVLRFIAREYRSGSAQWMADQMVQTGGRRLDGRAVAWHVYEFLYYDPSVQPQPPIQLPTAKVLPDIEAVIWRTGWGQDDLVFGLKSGAYGGRFIFDTFTQEVAPWEGPCAETKCKLSQGHDHDDTNTFYLWKGGWLAPEVEQPGNWQTAFHNTLLVDGRGQDRPTDNEDTKPQAFVGTDGFLEATANTTHFDYVAADATRRYASKGMQDFTRYVVFIRPDYLLMLDNVAAAEAHEYTWMSHFVGKATVNGNWIEGTNGEQLLGIGIVAPHPFKADTGKKGRNFAQIRTPKDVANVRFINVLYPTTHSEWANRPDFELLADSGQAALVRLRWDESGRVDDILIRYDGGAGSLTVGPYATDARVAVVVRNSSGDINATRQTSGTIVERLFVYGGTFLRDTASGENLASGLDPATPFEFSGEQ
jgi:hypothetical protein